MEKNDLVGDALKIMPPEYVPLLYQGKLLRNDTSGSTGKCLEVYWKKDDFWCGNRWGENDSNNDNK